MDTNTIDVKKFKKKIREIPFGNSQFQIINFIANQETLERIYRACLLQLNQKLKAMENCRFQRQRREIDIKEIEKKLKKAKKYEKRRLLVDLEENKYHLEDEIKYIEDCIIEIKTYEKIIEDLPNFTREDFEKSERLFWEKKLITNANQELKTSGRVEKGTLQSLEKLGISIDYSQGQPVFIGNIKHKKEIGLKEVEIKSIGLASKEMNEEDIVDIN